MFQQLYNELLTIKSTVLLLTHQTPKYTFLQSFVYFKSPVPAVFASFEVSIASPRAGSLFRVREKF